MADKPLPEYNFTDGTRVLYRNLTLKHTNEITDLTDLMRAAKTGSERMKATVDLLRKCVTQIGTIKLEDASDDVILELDHRLVRGILAKMTKVFPPLD